MFANMSLFGISAWVLPVLLAITFHEAAHGYVAWRLGDDTAYRQGRVTFNPFRHIDPFGTIVLPALLFFVTEGQFLFGWAKPVPVNFFRLRRPKRDMVWVAAAGPGINIVLALASALLAHRAPFVPDPAVDWVLQTLANSIFLNLLLAVFNMIPLPPLDGGRVAVGLLPPQLARPLARLERFGLLILIAVLFLLPPLSTSLVGLRLDLFSALILPIVWIFQDLVFVLTGHI